MSREINVIIAGATGNGKSTFVNAFANIARHRTLEDAEQNVTEVAIPVRYTDGRTAIREGADENERQQQAGSRTAEPRIYSFPTRYATLRLIDTPGIGDSEGSAFDEVHIANIISCITRFDKIHGILLFFKSTDNVLNTSARYQLCELLSCLGKAAVNNISFVITHAGGLGTPGESSSVIDAFIRTLGVHIPRTEENTFCFENDSFFYLIGRSKAGNSYSVKHRNYFMMTYQNNVQEYVRLFRRIFHCPTTYTVSNIAALKKARQLWPILSPRLALLDAWKTKIEDDIKELDGHVTKLMWEIMGEKGNLQRIKTERYEVDVTKQRIDMEIQEFDVTRPEIEWDTTEVDVAKQRIEFEQKEYDVTRYKVVNEAVKEEVRKERVVTKMVEREVQKQKVVYVEPGGNFCETPDLFPPIWPLLLPKPKPQPEPKVIDYTETETSAMPTVEYYTDMETRIVPKVEAYTEKETRAEPKIVDYYDVETRQVPKVVHRREKEQRQVPKVVEYKEKEQREKQVIETDPEVQKKIADKEAAKCLEQKRREKREAEYSAFMIEKQKVRELERDFARCLHENTIVAFSSAKKQYLSEELAGMSTLNNSAEDVQKRERLKLKWLEEDEFGRAFGEVNSGNIENRPVVAPVELLEKVKEMVKLKYFGPYIKQALDQCETHRSVTFKTVTLDGAAMGYIFDEIVNNA